MRILITGGAGFIGSSLTKSFLKDGHEVVVVDNFSTGREENVNNIQHSNLNIVKVDLSNKSSIKIMDDILKNIDIVYHLASSIGVKLITENPIDTFNNSMDLNHNLFPLFEKYNVKVIYSSTSEVYGETKNKSGSKETDSLEILPIQKPRGSYACSKLYSEMLLSIYSFPYTIVRFFNVVGPSQVEDYGHVLPKFINNASKNIPLPVLGDGQQIRSLCDIRDAVEMLKLLIDSKHEGQLYNIGNDKNVCTMYDLATKIIQNLDSTTYVEFVPYDEVLGTNFDEIYNRYPNIDKIKEYYTCQYNLEDIIRNTYETNFNSNSPHG